ncbi:hypothetical protein CSUI_007842 [Cystoisospora suis]|uniref:Uncharacterized protein n=1 Tax=Cystoisospora suis TaxID=483139 RepID=A0A2C6KPD5_9APIC|nr:hypothetical protein CSUI_007842 [Cystoisospora suis]
MKKRMKEMKRETTGVRIILVSHTVGFSLLLYHFPKEGKTEEKREEREGCIYEFRFTHR